MRIGGRRRLLAHSAPRYRDRPRRTVRCEALRTIRREAVAEHLDSDRMSLTVVDPHPDPRALRFAGELQWATLQHETGDASPEFEPSFSIADD